MAQSPQGRFNSGLPQALAPQPAQVYLTFAGRSLDSLPFPLAFLGRSPVKGRGSNSTGMATRGMASQPPQNAACSTKGSGNEPMDPRIFHVWHSVGAACRGTSYCRLRRAKASGRPIKISLAFPG